MLDLLLAIVIAGVPLGLISYWLFGKAYEKGVLFEKRTYKTRAEKKADKKAFKQSLKEKRKTDKGVEARVLYKWIRMGGGYYGIMAFLTLIYLEVSDLLGFLTSREAISAFFADLGFETIVMFFVNQLQTFIQAMVWFSVWPDVLPDIPFILLLLASYAGFWTGQFMAKRQRKNNISSSDESVQVLEEGSNK